MRQLILDGWCSLFGHRWMFKMPRLRDVYCLTCKTKLMGD